MEEKNYTVKCMTVNEINRNNITYKISELADNATFSKECLICGESVELSENEVIALQYGHHIDSKICDNCKRAVLYVRHHIMNN